ncbi:MAG: hypothetical protein WCI27_00960 [Candidatus Omnitrophota bacterium]
MSIKIKQSILILGVLVALAVIAGYILFVQKQSAEARVATLSEQITQYETKSMEQLKKLSTLQAESDKMRKEMDLRNSEKDELVKKSDSAQREVSRLNDEIVKIKKENSTWDDKIAGLRRERDELIKQVMDLKNRPGTDKTVEKVVSRDHPAAEGALPEGADQSLSVQAGSDLYWAGVVRQKAALELEVKKLKDELNKNNLLVAELKKSNSDADLELGRVKNERDEIVRKIKYGEDLADNLSVELARARNEQKMTTDHSEQLITENQQLRLDIKQLTTTKIALEKSIASLSDEKNAIEKKLVETENIIQGRIDEIWQIKKDIDKRFDGKAAKPTGDVELAPIVVNKEEPVQEKPVSTEKIAAAKAPVKAPAKAGVKAAVKAAPAKVVMVPSNKIQGTIVSLNEDNNFVIIDQGEKTGIKVGDAFNVFHRGVQVGTIEIIQVRQDISAADIKQKSTALAIGDIVK